MKKKNKRNKNRQGRLYGASVGQASNSYRGPIVLPLKGQNADIRPANMHIESTLTTNGAGVASPVISTALTQWDETTNYQNIYDEWRLVGVKVEYVPFTPVPTASLTPGQLALCIDRDTATNLTGIPQALAQGGKLINPFERVTFEYKMESSDESAFSGSNSFVNVWVKAYGTGLGVTQNYGVIHLTGLWQFRGQI